MTTTPINGNTFIFLQVPEGAYDFRVDYGGKIVLSFAFFDKPSDGIDLPAGRFRVIGLASDLTEDQWEWFMEQYAEPGYWIKRDSNGDIVGTLTDTESGLSLLQSLNLNPQTTLILKKV